jgi:hypothetical protein
MCRFSRRQMSATALRWAWRPGELVKANVANAIFIPTSKWVGTDGSTAMFPHIMIDRYMPGSIAVDPSGKRFVSEGDSYQNFVL